MDKPEAPVLSRAAAVAAPPPAAPEKGAPPTTPPRRRYPTAVRAWLIAGLVLIFVQVVVGGITRLTGSGLSITKWEIVTGTLPPLSEAAWEGEFALYKDTPQYEKMNEGMSMSDFKFIYFWEYFHRLWARMMGLVFVFPLAYFVLKGYIDRRLGKRLALVFAAAALTASFGWIMVASGLIERPLVNAYKLSMHLGIAFTTFGILLWTALWAFDVRLSAKPVTPVRKTVYALAGVLVVQILLGGVMSGMKAALAYPTWPDLNGAAVPGVLLEAGAWTLDNVIHYDSHPFMSALVQLLHRTVGYAVAAIVTLLLWRGWRAARGRWRVALALTGTLTLLQILLGIGTVILSEPVIPVSWGVLHQAGALFLLSAVLYDVWLVRAVPLSSRPAPASAPQPPRAAAHSLTP